jgi:hypothetical protein
MFRNRGREWGHLKVPGWRGLLERYPAENHLRCAWQWRESVRLAREEARPLPPGRYMELRFEDLVVRPEETAAGALSFLGLDMTPAVRQAARRQVRHYVENHSRRVGRFRENLTPRQVEEIQEVCGPLLEELGYSCGSRP